MLDSDSVTLIQSKHGIIRSNSNGFWGVYKGFSVGDGSPKAPRWDRQAYAAGSRFGAVRSTCSVN
jgi:hypothetical protein